MARDPTRRTVLGGGLAGVIGVAVGSCTSEQPQPVPAPPPSGPPPSGSPLPPPVTSTTAPAGETPGPVRVPVFPQYVPLPSEVEPGRKVAAAAVLTAALTTPERSPGSAADPAAGLADRVAAAGQDPAPAAALLPLLAPGVASAVWIVYPQSGGLSPDLLDARAMVVAEQHVVEPAEPAFVVSRTLTVFMAVTRTDVTSPWRVTEVRLPPPVVPRAVEEVSPAVRALLDDPRVVLPEAARLDLLGPDGIDDRVAVLLTTLAQQWVVDVSVLRSGHETNVFGTDRTSNHAVGRAVDIWALDGIPVIERDRSPWRAAMEAAAGLGASEVGGPEELAPEPYFTNPSHQDHVHVGFGPR